MIGKMHRLTIESTRAHGDSTRMRRVEGAIVALISGIIVSIVCIAPCTMIAIMIWFLDHPVETVIFLIGIPVVGALAGPLVGMGIWATWISPHSRSTGCPVEKNDRIAGAGIGIVIAMIGLSIGVVVDIMLVFLAVVVAIIPIIILPQ